MTMAWWEGGRRGPCILPSQLNRHGNNKPWDAELRLAVLPLSSLLALDDFETATGAH